jgi:chemotaxis protein CheD
MINTEKTYLPHFLYPATLCAESRPMRVQTILGSCVSVCLFDTLQNIGGINHFMLPIWTGTGLATPKYGDIAIEKLVERMIGLGTHPGNLIAKIFGGSELINNSRSVGPRNVELARHLLAQKNIPILGASVGGKFGRKIIFNTQTGQVFMRHLTQQHN